MSENNKSKSANYSSLFMNGVKAVLPGIIVSLVGGTAGFFIFNNPVKHKAKATYEVWNHIQEYEKIFQTNVEYASCLSDSLDNIRFRKDYTHQLNIIIQNMQDLKNESGTDKRLSVVLNSKMAQYEESKKITEEYLDIVIPLLQKYNQDVSDSLTKKKILELQNNYLVNLAHIESRDTINIRDLAGQLTKSYKKYTGPFTIDFVKRQPGSELLKYLPGTYRLVELGMDLTVNKDSTGQLVIGETNLPFNWKLHDKVLDVKFEDETHHFILLKANERALSFLWQEKEMAIVLGCRR